MPHRFPALIAAPAAGKQSLWLTNARLFDGTGAPIGEHAAVLVEGGRISRIGGAGGQAGHAVRRVPRTPGADLREDHLGHRPRRPLLWRPAETLVAATRTAAEALGLAGELGTIAEGKLADLLVVDDDPLTDSGVLADPARIHLVLQLGVPVAGALVLHDPPCRR